MECLFLPVPTSTDAYQLLAKIYNHLATAYKHNFAVEQITNVARLVLRKFQRRIDLVLHDENTYKRSLLRARCA